jgi:hypothetical protein
MGAAHSVVVDRCWWGICKGSMISVPSPFIVKFISTSSHPRAVTRNSLHSRDKSIQVFSQAPKTRIAWKGALSQDTALCKICANMYKINKPKLNETTRSQSCSHAHCYTTSRLRDFAHTHYHTRCLKTHAGMASDCPWLVFHRFNVEIFHSCLPGTMVFLKLVIHCLHNLGSRTSRGLYGSGNIMK